MKKFTRISIHVILLMMLLLGAGCVPGQLPTENPQISPEPTTAPVSEPVAEKAELILATTTSTDDSGLLDAILPVFEEQCDCTISVVAVGSGQAIQMGVDGNADVLLVHSPAAEKTFMDEGNGTRREDVMYNDFVIVGPENDPAGINGMSSAADAFKQIAESKAVFVSRGDDSGTHSKEKNVWKSAEIEPGGDWYISAGQGMGAVLTMADEMSAYTLSDRATYLARTKEGLISKILVEGDSLLFNPYGVIAVNPEKNPNIKIDLANQFIDWLISVPTQDLISQFGQSEFGQPLFTPDSDLWNNQ